MHSYDHHQKTSQEEDDKATAIVVEVEVEAKQETAVEVERRAEVQTRRWTDQIQSFHIVWVEHERRPSDPITN